MTARAALAQRQTLTRYLVLAIGIAGLSMAGVLYKLATAPTLAIVAWRMTIAVVLTAPVLWLSRARPTGQRSLSVSRADAIAAAAAGALFACDIALWAISLEYTTVPSAALLVSMDPIFVAIFAAVILKERLSLAMVVGMVIAAGGAALITVGDFRISGRALIGDMLALSAAFAETGYLLLGRYVRQRVDTMRYVTIVYTACALCLWFGLVAMRTSAGIDARNLLVCVALAVFATLLGHTLVSKSLGHMPAAVVAIAFLSQPVMTAGLAYLVLRQGVAPMTAIGGTIALIGVGVVVFANERYVEGAPPQPI